MGSGMHTKVPMVNSVFVFFTILAGLGKSTDAFQIVGHETKDINRQDSRTRSWDLQEDWLLIDQVPLFTIHSTNSIHNSSDRCLNPTNRFSATFWTQLRHATPLLSHRTEEELEDRYRLMLHEYQSQTENHKKSVTAKTRGKTEKLTRCGESPDLLTEWWTEKHSHGATMGGVLLDGSKIWFPLAQVGTLRGNHLSSLDEYHSICSNSEGWNYAEAMGGHIYELGIPSRIEQEPAYSQTMTEKVSLTSLQIPSKIVSWLHSRNRLLAAIFAASVLSATITLSSDRVFSDDIQAAQTPIVLNIESSRMTTSFPSQTFTTTTSNMVPDRNELSITGQRARQELRVEREKMALENIQARLKSDELRVEREKMAIEDIQEHLKSDELTLRELLNEENRLEAIKYGFTK